MTTYNNAVNDDGLYGASEAVALSTYETTTGTSTPQEKAVGGGATIAGTAQGSGVSSPIKQENSQAPGKRPYNPLSKFSSYTYQLTLYMVTPDVRNAFISSGRRSFDSKQQGVYVIARSGGINKQTDNRYPTMDFDYYIDDLKITNAIAGTGNTTTPTWIWEFTITEPYGFSFISRLKEGLTVIKNNSKLPNVASVGNSDASRQSFMMVIQFLGYDESGNVINKSDQIYKNIPETYYDIYFTELKFKLDGRAVVYRIKAADVGQTVGAGTQKGTVNNPTKIEGKTVLEAFNGPNGLFTKLNNREVELTQSRVTNVLTNTSNRSKSIPDVYEIQFAANADMIRDSTLPRYDTVQSVPMGRARDVNFVNEATSLKSLPDLVTRQLMIDGGMPILQAIEYVILRSKYIQDGINFSLKSNNQPNQNGNYESESNSKKIPLTWIRISIKATDNGYDEITKSYAKKITFIVTPYEIPHSQHPYAASKATYPGAYKRYDYWFTGQNSEMIRFEQQYNNLYYLSGIIGGKDSNSSVPIQPNQKSGSDVTGKKDQNLEPQAITQTSLQDISAHVSAVATILGDPDFLMQPYSFGDFKYYDSTGYRLANANSQVFIEINFLEGLDYNYNLESRKQTTDDNTGLLTVNKNILFYMPEANNPPTLKGLSYQLLKCTHNFSKGKFTQDLQLALHDFGGIKDQVSSSHVNPSSAEVQREYTSLLNRYPNAEAQNDVDNLLIRYPTAQGLLTDIPPTTVTPNVSQNQQNEQNNNSAGNTNDDAQGDAYSYQYLSPEENNGRGVP